MKKIMKLINISILLLAITLYFLLTFVLNIDLGTGHKELENIILIALPCFMILFYGFTIKDSNQRRKCLILYLIAFIAVMIGFMLSNNRSNILISENIMFKDHNIIPFHSIMELLSSDLGLKFGLYNIIGNFLMLIPLAILLPMIFKKQKKTRLFCITLIILCLSIEIIQYLTKLGSFDIDDFILNFSGALIIFLISHKTRFKTILDNIFIERTFSKIFCYIIWYLLLVIFLFFSIKRLLLVQQYYLDNKVDMTNINCIADEKTYLGDIKNYHYYSRCNYGESYIIVGKLKYKIEDFIKSPKFNDKYLTKLGLQKEEIITDVILNPNKNKKVNIYSDEYENVYLYGYDEFNIKKDGIEYNVIQEVKDNKLNISFIHDLTELIFLDNKNGYGVEKGTYYKILTCTEAYSNYSEFYILNSNFNIDKNTCSQLKTKIIEN